MRSPIWRRGEVDTTVRDYADRDAGSWIWMHALWDTCTGGCARCRERCGDTYRRERHRSRPRECHGSTLCARPNVLACAPVLEQRRFRAYASTECVGVAVPDSNLATSPIKRRCVGLRQHPPVRGRSRRASAWKSFSLPARWPGTANYVGPECQCDADLTLWEVLGLFRLGGSGSMGFNGDRIARESLLRNLSPAR